METHIILAITVIIGFYMAWNIGANDVSNAMGTSVGSKALTLKQAVILAGILEFVGAFFLGSHVSNTIQTGIVQPEVFAHEPHLFTLGMMGALLATGFWLNLASLLRLPVSTTHAIVGAVVGFGAIVGGVHGLDWPNILKISLSWIISPAISGFVAFGFFLLLQRRVLFAFHPLQAAKKLIPFLIFVVISFFSLSLIYNGLASLNFKISFAFALLIAIILGSIAAIISYFLSRNIRISIKKNKEHHPQQVMFLEKAAKHLQRTKLSSDGEVKDTAGVLLQEVRKLTSEIKGKAEYIQNASEYNKIEKIFAYFQIFSAAMVAFAHGANDVANAIGPVAAVIQTVKMNMISEITTTPRWILALGGVGIVVGLATWGWRVIETIGHKITQLTPTRGFCAEFASALVILVASKMGMPISTTHALVGAVLGVGLAKGLSALNLKMLRTIILSWIITIPSCAVISIGFFYLLRLIF